MQRRHNLQLKEGQQSKRRSEGGKQGSTAKEKVQHRHQEVIEQLRAHFTAASDLVRTTGPESERLSWLIEDLLIHIEESLVEQAADGKGDAFNSDTVDSIIQSFENPKV